MDNRAEFPMASIPASSAFVIRFPTEPRFFFYSFEIIAKTAQNVNFLGDLFVSSFMKKVENQGVFPALGWVGPGGRRKRYP